MKTIKPKFKSYLFTALIFTLHIILFIWLIYILKEAGGLTTFQVFLHFIFISLMGAALIRFCAFYYKRKFEREMIEKNVTKKRSRE